MLVVGAGVTPTAPPAGEVYTGAVFCTRLRVKVIEPGSGYLACGMVGGGRLAEPAAIVAAVAQTLRGGAVGSLVSEGERGAPDSEVAAQNLDFAGEIVLNDHEPAALELAEYRLRPVTTQYRLAPGSLH